ncbi:MAG: hypothetical protein ACLS5G_00675 [Streptococcus sp.]
MRAQTSYVFYYDRFSMKEKRLSKAAYNKVRVTLDQNLTYRDEDVSLFKEIMVSSR